ncbi:MAG TPA: pyridoxal-dependent decarboxylase [Bryobacteraceae bacterium]|nr:pyridoxal-dependent decarboxylase [Bryobacteraceae bacterium]HPT25017.1 pyridoxal-dependent decarboxylase [Bryobacteraceae bacterium]
MTPFDMSPEEFRRHGHAVVDWIAGYLENTRDYPVLARIQPGDLASALPPSAPDQGEPMEAILADFQRQILPAVTHWNHPGFHAYFSVSASAPGILGEMLAAALNVNSMVWLSCPASVELEAVVMSWLRQWIGLPESFFGMIHDTASVSTLHAIAAARAVADPGIRQIGAARGLVVYTSEHAHSSVEKGALSLGIGRDHVRKIGVDAQYRMDPALLRQAIAADLTNGLKPCCVVSTTGTTSVASVDPVAAIQDIADEFKLWHHIDAAYGGPAAILPERRWILDGAERADSLVINPHKWLFTPMDFSGFYCRRPDILRQAFALVPEYLKTSQDNVATNLMDYGIPLGRRFRALKLWFVMRYFGREKVQSILRAHIEWAAELRSLIEADPRFEIAAPTLFSLVCFRLKSGDDATRALLEAINASGKSFVSGNVLDGRFVIRYAIGNIGTTREDILGDWSLLQSLAG